MTTVLKLPAAESKQEKQSMQRHMLFNTDAN